ncbi:MAG TPA: glycoside hydrolase family 3 protein, partial [Microbacterium sp.]|nr:glycoside hydrolase family 3 protein [Microbacterium sp.]
AGSALPRAEAGYDAADVVRRSVSVTGSGLVAASALAVIDARRRSSLAVDSAAGYVSRTLADGEFTVRLDVEASSAETQESVLADAIAASGTTVLLVDRPDADAGQRALVERAALRDPGAVVVNVGLAARHPLPLPTIEVGAASRVGAQVARERLFGRNG